AAAGRRAGGAGQRREASGVSVASVDCAAAGAVRCWAPATSLARWSRSSRSASSSASSGLRPTRIRQRRNPPRARCASSERRSTEMCGVIGYTGGGRRDASSILVRGLARLEYRGYDSAGVAVHTGDGIVTRKPAGRVPGLLGIGDDEFFVASDASAIIEYTRSVVHLNDGDIAVLTPQGYHILDRESHVQLRAVDDVTWDLEAIALGPYAHFMQKEIFEQ